MYTRVFWSSRIFVLGQISERSFSTWSPPHRQSQEPSPTRAHHEAANLSGLTETSPILKTAARGGKTNGHILAVRSGFYRPARPQDSRHLRVAQPVQHLVRGLLVLLALLERRTTVCAARSCRAQDSLRSDMSASWLRGARPGGIEHGPSQAKACRRRRGAGAEPLLRGGWDGEHSKAQAKKTRSRQIGVLEYLDLTRLLEHDEAWRGEA